MASRVRPSRLARWRRYVPGLTLAVLAILPALAPTSVTEPFGVVGLDHAGARIVLLVVPILGAMLAARLANRSPVPPLAVGTAGLTLGGNVFAGPTVAGPMIVLGLGWCLFEEARRLFEGITIPTTGLTIHRPIRDPLDIDYEDVRAVHTTPTAGGSGTLILETEHGTVTAPALPGCQALQARVEARMHRKPVHPTTDSIEQARARLDGLVSGGVEAS